ncbi:MAG: N-acetyl-gamma-glutamyl-phosphate reductase, partial [Gammaproteobacteria bacterium]
MSAIEVCILGGAGYGGGELMRLLLAHPRVRRIRAVSRRHAGEPFANVHPNLRGLLSGNFEDGIDWRAWRCERPVVFSAMPSGALAGGFTELEVAWRDAELADRLVLIDLSGDFRIADAGLYAEYYRAAHPLPEALGSFVYGLSEWRSDRLRGARRIANPGCFATAVELALLPLADMPSLGRVCVSAMTGSSGSGAAASPTAHHATRANDLMAYKVLNHRHVGEIIEWLASAGSDADIAFVPHSTPLVRGIFATVQFDLSTLRLSASDFRSRYENCYARTPFVRLVEGSPHVAAVAGSNFCDLSIHTNGTYAVVLTALDNLGKGMAGQAIQNLNLSLGWEPTLGLLAPAPFP